MILQLSTRSKSCTIHSFIIPKKENLFRPEMHLTIFQSPEPVCGPQQASNRQWEIPAAWGNTGKPEGSTPPTTSTAGLVWLQHRERKEGARTECTEPQCTADKGKFRELQPHKVWQNKQTWKPGQPPTPGHLKIRIPIQGSAVTTAHFAAWSSRQSPKETEDTPSLCLEPQGWVQKHALPPFTNFRRLLSK